MRRFAATAAVLAFLAVLVVPAAGARASLLDPDPDYSVVLKPEGTPVGHVIALHGGGWLGSNEAVDAIAPTLQYVADWGWKVHVVGYRSGTASLDDVIAWFDRLRAATRRPICVWGESAGGNLALLLAAERRLKCVIAQAAPTYLPETDKPWDIADQWDPAIALRLGADMLERFSPLLWHASIDEPVLLGHAKLDPLVPVGQSRVFHRRDDDARFLALDPGLRPFTHTTVDGSDLRQFHHLEHRMLRSAAR